MRRRELTSLVTLQRYDSCNCRKHWYLCKEGEREEGEGEERGMEGGREERMEGWKRKVGGGKE